MKIVFLNDLHPNSNPGAASIAYALAEEASEKYQVEFWCTNIIGVPLPENGRVEIKVRNITKARAQKMEGGLLQRLYFELVGFLELFWVVKQVITSRPTHIWFHQIGNRFPKILIPICRILRISTLTTLHDFGVLLGRKLYPSDFGWSLSSVDSHINQIHLEQPRIVQGRGSQDILLCVRKGLVRYCLNRSSSLICISNLQEEILKASGLTISDVIPNGVKKCTCTLKLKVIEEKFNILFAGRPNAKGLELLAQAVSEDSNSHLHLAGPSRLLEIAAEYLDSNRFTYYGSLSSLEICELIHQVDLVSVISQCFDVYPTITLEALAHGTPVLTTPLTGNSRLVESLSPDLVVHASQKPDLAKVAYLIKQERMDFPTVMTVTDTWELYEKILIQIS